MKLLLFGDVHSNKRDVEIIKKKAKNADLLVCIGDVTMFEAHMDLVLKDLAGIKKTILMLPGNHEIEEDLEDACRKHKNIIYLHKDHYEADEYIFLAWGTGGFAQEDHQFEKKAKEWEKLIKGKKVILLTHSPPHGTVDTVGRNHVGNKSYTKFIKKVQPVLAVCGHLHENFHKTGRIGKTFVINPGPEGKLYVV